MNKSLMATGSLHAEVSSNAIPASATNPTASFTANAMMIKPATAQRNWDSALNSNADLLDGMAAIGQLTVTVTESPSASLNIRVTQGSYRKTDGTIGTYPGCGSLSLTASTTTCLWLTDAGVLNMSSAFPTTANVQLATVVTGSSTVTSISDNRVCVGTAGSGLGSLFKVGDALTDTLVVQAGSSQAAVFAVNPTQPGIGFFGATPASQANSIPGLVDHSTGSISNTIVDVGSTFSEARIDANFATLTAAVNALIQALKHYGLMAS